MTVYGATNAVADHDGGVIHACLNSQGNLRIVGSRSSCHPSETAQMWGQTGPAGPGGPARRVLREPRSKG